MSVLYLGHPYLDHPIIIIRSITLDPSPYIIYGSPHPPHPFSTKMELLSKLNMGMHHSWGVRKTYHAKDSTGMGLVIVML